MATSVLVIDDDPDVLGLMQALLTANGYIVHCCNGGSTAYERAKALRPGAIILDLVMPDCDGWRVLDQLNADPETARIPCLICSAVLPLPIHWRGKLEDFSYGLLAKPFEYEVLLSVLAGLVAKQLVN